MNLFSNLPSSGLAFISLSEATMVSGAAQQLEPEDIQNKEVLWQSETSEDEELKARNLSFGRTGAKKSLKWTK
jgi:hypothetical protein